MASALDAVLHLRDQEQAAREFQSQQLSVAAEIFQRARAQAQNAAIDIAQLNQQQKQFDVNNALNKQKFYQDTKYQDATIENQKADNIRLGEQLNLDKKKLGLDILKQNSQNRLHKQQNIVDLAIKGLKQNPDGAIIRDDSLLSEEEKYLRAGKIAEAARNMGDRETYNKITGNNENVVNEDTAQSNINLSLGDKYTESTTGHTIDTQKLSEEEKLRLAPDNILTQLSSKKDSFTKELTPEATNAKYVLDQRKTRSGDEANLVGPNFQFDKSIRKIEELISRPDFDWGPFGAARVNSGNATLANQPELKEIQTYLNDVKQIGFLTGGKQLTESEKKLILANLDPTGKTKEEFLRGLKLANEKVQNKAYSLGGVDARKFDLTPEESASERPVDIVPTGGLGNEMLRSLLIAQRSGTDMLTFGNSKNVDKLMESIGARPKGISDVRARINPQNPLEHMINAAPNLILANQLLRAGAGYMAARGARATAELANLKPVQVMDKTIKDVRANLLNKSDDLSKAGYIQREHEIYSKAIDGIKATDSEVKNAAKLLDDFALRNKDEFGNFNTPEIKQVYDKLSTTDNLTEAKLFDAIKQLKGKFKGTVDSNKSMNLSAAKDLTEGFSGEAADAIKNANMRYSQFKPVEKDIDDLIGLYGNKTSSKSTDSAINNLLRSDFANNPNQANVLTKIGQETGIDLKGTTDFYGGKYKLAESVKPNFFGANLSKLISGTKGLIKGKPLPKSEVNSESMRILKGIK